MLSRWRTAVSRPVEKFLDEAGTVLLKENTEHVTLKRGMHKATEQHDEVMEAIVVGQPWDDDVRVVLFVKLAEGLTLDAALENAIKSRIRANTTPRHVPSKINQVADIPRTKSGKITELAVRDVICGRPVQNREALANPEALDLYQDLPALKE